MTDDTLLPFDLPAVRRKKLTVDFEGGNQSSNGGALLLREAERDVGVCRRLAETMPDRRDPDHIQHKMVEMVTARVTAIACGHEDAIDHNDLRHDPVMRSAAVRRAARRWARNRPLAGWRMRQARPMRRGSRSRSSTSSPPR